MKNDSRKAARISTNLKLISRNSGNSVDSFIMNMSTGGAFIKTSHLLPVDAEFSLNLQLPGDTEIMTIPGRVVWTKSVSSASPAGMGIQFTNVSPHHHKKLADFVEKHSSPQTGQEPVKLYM
jgi:uncharacterized protein (TIGR02266 family)